MLAPQFTLAKNLGFDGGTTAKVEDTVGFISNLIITLMSIGACATYNILAGPVTPFIDANLGGTYVNTDIADGPPVTGCYWDPWYGYICGVAQPTKSGTFPSYGVGGGLRWDVNQWLFFRGAARQQWIDLPNTGVPSFTIFKVDVRFKF